MDFTEHASLSADQLVGSVTAYAIFLLDPDGRVASWNPGAEQIKGYRADEILGRHFSLFYTPEDVAEGKPGWALETTRAVGHLEDEGWRVRKDGSRFWANVVIAAVRDAQGVLQGFAKVTRDLTQRRRDEEALAQAHAELERFSYSVSHDLRAPLRAISGYAQALFQDHAAALDSEGQRLLRVIADNAKLGGQLIDGLLSLARLARGPVATARVDVTALARSVVDGLRQLQDGATVEVVFHPLPAAIGDTILLRQVFTNLIGNAFKFTRGRPNPRVEIGARPQAHETAYFVTDNGVGFDMQYANKLFGVFQRLHRADEFEGAGVGLALAQRIVHRHGGRIWADAKPNEGATFWFTLPQRSLAT